ncbi:MAG: hypothetical protein ACK559_24025, partial [bacterium]
MLDEREAAVGGQGVAEEDGGGRGAAAELARGAGAIGAAEVEQRGAEEVAAVVGLAGAGAHDQGGPVVPDAEALDLDPAGPAPGHGPVGAEGRHA